MENDFTKWIEEQTGLTLEFELFPTTDSQQKLEIMVNGGAKLPETLIAFALSDAAVLNYGQNGVFTNLKDYFDQGLAVNFAHAMTTITDELTPEQMLAQITSADGGIYAYPSYGSQIYDQYPNRW